MFSTALLAAADDANSFEFVKCINLANGYTDTVWDTRWKLEQAVLEVPFEHERNA